MLSMYMFEGAGVHLVPVDPVANLEEWMLTDQTVRGVWRTQTLLWICFHEAMES